MPPRKLNYEIAEHIRALYADGTRLIDLSKQFGVDNGTLIPLLKRQTWKRPEGQFRRTPTDPLPRFWKRVQICGHGKSCKICCWPWMGPLANGYGVVYWLGKQRRVNRVVWELDNNKPLPPELWALHHCDNPPCANPHHIYAGTPKNNFDDCIRRNRGHTTTLPHKPGRRHVNNFPKDRRGETHASAKLTEKQVREILKAKELLVCGGRDRVRPITRKMLATKYGIALQTLDAILYGKTWKHLNP